MSNKILVPTRYDCPNGSWILGESLNDSFVAPPEFTSERHLERWRQLTANPNLYSRPLGSDPNDNSVFRPQDAYYASLAFGGEPYTVQPIIEKQLRIACNWWWVVDGRVQYHYGGWRNVDFYFNVGYYIDIYTRTSTGSKFRGTPYDHFWEFVKINSLPSSILTSCVAFFPVKPKIYLGTAAPPPLRNMNCCSCNDIATIIAENAIAETKQHQATRDLIDRRTLEGLREINKMLQGMQINLDLQPVIDRLNQLEANLWNGLNLSGGEGN